MGDMVMLTLGEIAGHPPSLDTAAVHFSVPVEAFDQSFGVILVDPQRKLYAVRVDNDSLGSATVSEEAGPFSDPKIVPFGTPTE